MSVAPCPLGLKKTHFALVPVLDKILAILVRPSDFLIYEGLVQLQSLISEGLKLRMRLDAAHGLPLVFNRHCVICVHYPFSGRVAVLPDSLAAHFFFYFLAT